MGVASLIRLKCQSMGYHLLLSFGTPYIQLEYGTKKARTGIGRVKEQAR